jgi:hypothetical protein
VGLRSSSVVGSAERGALAAAVLLAGCGGTPIPDAPAQHFHSRPDLEPPTVRIDTPAHGTAPGYVFLAPKRHVVQAGPLILDDAGQVVWFRPLDTHAVTDLQVQRYRGRPVLTWWQGRTENGVGRGGYRILDASYRTVAIVHAGHGLHPDIHEFRITPRGTALFTIFRPVPRDLSALGGPEEGLVIEGVVQEVDIASGRVLFEWHSLPHVGIDESYSPVPREQRGSGYDYFHVNAIDVDRDGNLLISARNTHAVYKVDRTTGRVLWRLGGKRSDFTLGPGTRFFRQHDVRRLPDGTISIFDNEASDTGRESRVLVLRVDERRMKAAFARSYTHPRHLESDTQGNAQFLPDGHVFVGWGSESWYTEFDRAGRVLLDAHFGARGDVDSYRAYRFPWVGRPRDRPAVAAEAGPDGRTIVYASWNGATEVARWRVLAGKDERELVPVAEAPRRGFETRIGIPSGTSWFAVQALGRAGRVLRTSKAVARAP